MPKTRRRKLPLVLLTLLAVLVGLPLGAWLLRGTVATAVARDRLAARGITCDERFAVELGPRLETATVGVTRCARAGGLVEAVELLGPLTVELDGAAPVRAHAASLRLSLRDRDVRGGTRWAPALRGLNLEQRVAGMVKGLAELSARELPPTTVDRLEVVRAGERVAAAAGLRLTPAGSMDLSAERITFTAGPMGVGRLELTEVRGAASPARVHLEGRATARASVGLLGSLSTGGRFTLDARGLDTRRPRFSLGGSL